jgi:hypothetical protein
LHADKKDPLARDLHQLIAKYTSRATQLAGLRGDRRFKGYPGAVAAINPELASSFGQVGTYRGDLATLLAPAAAAPGGIAFDRKIAGANLSLHTDQTAAANTRKPAQAAAAKGRVKTDRQRLANLYQGRINVLHALRRKPPRGMLGAILASSTTTSRRSTRSTATRPPTTRTPRRRRT